MDIRPPVKFDTFETKEQFMIYWKETDESGNVTGKGCMNYGTLAPEQEEITQEEYDNIMPAE